ncbi:hypothetical protein HJFPF1_13647 [Paramyrothecium foliicola]|nr:hypothetical protein HJFPF1_13647 [Paramyrothecium foliicola]
MDRRALIAWTLAKALLASSSTTLVRYVWELVGDDEHLSVTFSRLALIRDILSSKPAIRIQFLVRYYVYNLLQDDNLKGDALIDLTTRDADTSMERLSAVALAKTGDLNANLETELQETRLMWHFFEASGGCSDLIQQKYNWEYTIGDRLTKRGQLLRVDYEHVKRGYKSEAIREMILKSEVGKALNVTQIDGILAEIDPAHY